MVEVDHTRSVRVRAPLELVWNELSPLDRVIRQIPEVAYFKVQPDGRSLELSTRLSWGPLNWKFARATVAEAAAPRLMQWRGHAPSLQLDFEGTFELQPVPNGDDTMLTYRGVLRCRHKLVGRLRGPLASYIEAHVNSLTGRVAELAVQHAEADQRLGRRPDAE